MMELVSKEWHTVTCWECEQEFMSAVKLGGHVFCFDCLTEALDLLQSEDNARKINQGEGAARIDPVEVAEGAEIIKEKTT